ncbi:SCO2400 family protein [Streptomyces sp. NPDC002403]
MDYCSSCRRTLNGALACPGCGAYAPDIAPHGHHRHSPAAATTVAPMATVRVVEEWPAQEFPDSAGYFDTPHIEAEPAAPAPHVEAEPHMPAAPAPQGRAARRRQLARWKKHRRRAVLASTVALVGGGLTLAVLPSRPSTAHSTQASTAPEPKATATAADRTDAPHTETDAGTDTDAGADSPSPVRPRTLDARGSAADGRSHAVTGPPRAAAAVPATVTKSTRHTVTAARPATATSPRPPAGSAPAPRTTTPAPAPSQAGDPAADAPPPSPAPETTRPGRICVLVLCVG